MHHAANETRTAQPTPEQLLKLLDSQLTLARTKRATEDATPRRIALLVGGLLLIVAGCGAALLVLQQMLSDLRQRPAVDSARTEQNANF